MWLPPESSRAQRFRWVEVAHYVADLNAVIREKHPCNQCPGSCSNPTTHKAPKLYDWDDVYDYSRRHDDCGVYTSVFRYGDTDLDKAPRLGNLYFDFDHEEAPEIAHLEAQKVYSKLRRIMPANAVRAYFTGLKGFHLEAEAAVLGVDPSKELDQTFRFIAERLAQELQLCSLDLAVYDHRRMWRLPNTKHQKTGLYKVELPESVFFSPFRTIIRYAEVPRPLTDVELTFLPRANEWYRRCLVLLEEQRRKEREKRVEMFNRLGTDIVGKPTNRYARMVWDSALADLESAEPNKNRNRKLNAQAFRLYLLVESGNLIEDRVTTTLTEIALGLGLEPREVERTLGSARAAAARQADKGEFYAGRPHG